MHIPSDNLIVEALLSFEIKQSIECEKQGAARLLVRDRYLLSPLDTNPILSKGSCLTGRSLSHGAEDFRLSEPRLGGPLAILTSCCNVKFRTTVVLQREARTINTVLVR